MVGLEWVVGISIACIVLCCGVYYYRRCQKLVRLYFFYDETLIPYYLEQNQECLKHSDYAGSLHALSQIMHVYKRQVEISQSYYFRRFIRKPNTFSQTFLQDLEARCAILELQLQDQRAHNLSLLKHCRLWLMELERNQELNIDNRFYWKSSPPQELEDCKIFHIRPEERILYVKMMMLYAHCFKLLWCWHFSLSDSKDSDDLQRGVNFMARIFAANFACAKLLGMQELLPEHDSDYDSLKAYCEAHPIAITSLCEGINPELEPCTEHFPTEQELSGNQLHVLADSHVFYDPEAMFAFKANHSVSQLSESSH